MLNLDCLNIYVLMMNDSYMEILQFSLKPFFMLNYFMLISGRIFAECLLFLLESGVMKGSLFDCLIMSHGSFHDALDFIICFNTCWWPLNSVAFDLSIP